MIVSVYLSLRSNRADAGWNLIKCVCLYLLHYGYGEVIVGWSSRKEGDGRNAPTSVLAYEGQNMVDPLDLSRRNSCTFSPTFYR